MANHLANVKGLGAAKSGTHHFWVQRVTAVGLIPLTVWFVVQVLMLLHAGNDPYLWLQQPLNAILMLMMVPVLLKHSMLGLQVVIEDYVHCAAKKLTLLFFVKFATWAMMAAGILAILKIVLR